MKKPELVPTIFLIIAIVFCIVVPYNWQSIVSYWLASEPFAQVFCVIGGGCVLIGIGASFTWFYKSITRK